MVLGLGLGMRGVEFSLNEKGRQKTGVGVALWVWVILS